MKKKFLLVALLLACVSCAFSLAACGEDKPTPPAHSHEWSITYELNDTHHWHNCTADNCPITDNSQKDGYAAHDFTNGNCVCGKEKPEEQPPVVDNIKMSNFLTENAAIADIFIGDLVRPEAISAIDDDIKSEKCTLVANEDQEYLEQVNFVYTL